MAYTVFRSDNLMGTAVGTYLASVRVYDAEDKPIPVENGTIVVLGNYEEGEREVRKATLANAESCACECAIVAAPEVLYDERQKNLDEFINEAGSIVRAYIPHCRDMYSVTKDGFVGGTAPTEVGAEVGLGADGKLDAAATGWGTVEAIETTSRYTYYVIKIN